MRLVVLILLVVLAVWLVRRTLRPPEQKSGSVLTDGDLVACAHCGMHLPRTEARQAPGGLYCSEEHARLGKR